MDVTGTLVAILLGAFFLIALGLLFKKPLLFTLKLLANTALGFIALAVVRATSALTGITLGLNLFNAALIGILGLPGFLLLLLSQWVLG